jgi:O-antigen/teichoic acid export membrane protein
MFGIAAGLAKALALITVPYLTRALSPEGYGVADLATSTAALLTLVALFAGDIPTARAYGRTHDQSHRQVTLSSFVWAAAVASLGLTLMLLPAAPVIARTLWASGDLTPLAVLTLFLVPVSTVQAALAQTLRIDGRARTFAVVSVVDLVTQLGLAVLLVALGLGPAGVIIGFTVGSAIGLVVAAVAARGALSVRPDWSLSGRLMIGGLQFLPYAVMFVVADWALRSIVANVVGPEGVAELGLAIRIASALSLLGGAFALAWGPIGLARVNDARTAMLFGRVLQAYGLVSVAAALALGAVGIELLTFIAGPGYEGAAVVLPGLALAYAVAGTEYVLVVAAGVSDQAPRVVLAATLGAAIQVVGGVVLIPIAGMTAVGPVVLAGRLVSFATLFGGVQGAVSASVTTLAGSAAAVLVAYGWVQVVVAQDGTSLVPRWAFAAALAAMLLYMIHRARRSPRPEVT